MRIRTLLSVVSLTILGLTARGSTPPAEGLSNLPYADSRPWHLGFYVGMHTQHLNITHSGAEAEDGTGVWFVDQPGMSPGINIGGVADFRLSRYVNIRLTPGLLFGSRTMHFVSPREGMTERQTLKNALVTVPVDVKLSSLRWHNARPYLAAGVMPAFDVAPQRSNLLKTQRADLYLTVSVGSDFYLPYFKLIPEIRFALGLRDILDHKRSDIADDPIAMKYTRAISKARSSIVSLVFYFE